MTSASVLLALVLAGTLSAQILDDTRGLGARRAEPTPPEFEQLGRIANVIAIVRREYVDEWDEAMLTERCLKGMDEHLGAKKPKPARPVPGARPAERIGEYWRQAMPGDPEGRQGLGDACLRAMVNDLDRRTGYMGREELRELQVGAGGLGGIGLELEMHKGVLTVVEPIEGTPSERMGLQRGDRLVTVDGKPTTGLKLEEAVRLMRGKVGSTIVLLVERDGAKPMRIEGTRQIIRLQSVRTRQLEGGVLYVRISQFQDGDRRRRAARPPARKSDRRKNLRPGHGADDHPARRVGCAAPHDRALLPPERGGHRPQAGRAGHRDGAP